MNDLERLRRKWGEHLRKIEEREKEIKERKERSLINFIKKKDLNTSYAS